MEKSKIIGLQRKKVKLFPYNPEWKELYKKEEMLLCSLIEDYILDIQHVGSTSIPGVKAKPIIDIAVGVKSLKVGEKCIKPLEKLGYEYKHNAGIKGRHFFVKGSEMNRTHYLHIEVFNGKLWKNHILFRDYLRDHKEIIKKYNKLKERLASKYKDDRDTYTLKKDSFIEKILKESVEIFKENTKQVYDTNKRKPNKSTAHMLYGFVGAGKTTFAKKLEKETGALRFTNDEWMISLYGNNPPAEKFAEYYKRTNKLLLDTAFKCLKAGVDIILDDGFWSRSRRDKMRSRITKAGANFKLYYIKCSNEKMKQRVLKRSKDLSKNAFYIDEIAIKVFKKRFKPLGDDEEHIVIKNYGE